MLAFGCTSGTPSWLGGQRTPDSQPAEPAPAATALTPPPAPEAVLESRTAQIVLQVNFDVLRTRVPAGFFSRSGKVWNHLDEESIAADTSALLQRNGLRVGRGNVNSWPPIKALLEAERGVETSQSSIMVNNGFPLSIQLDPLRRNQTLFLFRDDASLPGVNMPMSSNFIRIEYTIPLDEPDALVVDVMPEIRLQPIQQELTINDLGQLDRPVLEPKRILRELAFRMRIGRDEFCAIGPSASAHRKYLAGTLLLCEEIEGQAYESMYFLTPRIVRSEGTVGGMLSGRAADGNGGSP